MATLLTSPAPSWSIPKTGKERRRYQRYAVSNSQLWISWIDPHGKSKMTKARVLNICEGGIGIELTQAPAAHSIIRFHSEEMKAVGTAKVCHIRQMGAKFYIGGEFVDGKRWIPPGEPIQEPIPLGAFYLPILLSAASAVIGCGSQNLE